MLTRTYKHKRADAETEFDNLQFCKTKKKDSLNHVYTKLLVRYDAEITWYDTHASRRRWWSGTVRLLAVILVTISLVFINARAFSSAPGSGTPYDTLLSFFGLNFNELTAFAVMIAIIAGGILLLDLVFQITARYARWRVTEYKIRIMRTAFEIAFLSKYGTKQEDQITLDVFNNARIM